MPCRSDYMEPSGNELESKRVCKFIIYIYDKIKKPVPAWIKETAKDYYGNIERLDEATSMLCNACRCLSEEEKEAIIYDAHDKTSRKLATWWENHQEWDVRRKKEDDQARKDAITRERALKKLSKEEMKALGLILTRRY